VKGKLVLVTHYFPSHCGGVERVADEMIRRLADDHGWDASWVASNTDPVPLNLPSNVCCIPAKSCNLLEQRVGIPWPLWSPASILNLWQLIGYADLVHIHDVLYFGNAFAWLFTRLRAVPLIVTQHIGDVPYRSGFLRHLHVFVNRTLGRLIMTTAERIVFISPAVQESFSKYCNFRVEPIYCPNGVDVGIFTPDGPLPHDPCIMEARLASRPIFIFVGRFIEKKGLNLLRGLATAFPDVLWIFAGHGPLDPRRWGLSNIHLVQGESGPGLARYYRAAQLLVLPSVGEGFPLVVQEAMACGTPAMVSVETAAGCPLAYPYMIVEKVGDNDTGRRWARRIEQVLRHPDGLQTLRQEAAEFAINNWSWERVAEVYSDLFFNLIKCSDKQ
jgi:glycosyltransferase involved in cell wall biosynthesis